MVDLQGNMFYDSDDKDQGVYIVDTNLNVTNAYVAPNGKIDRKQLGNLRDVKRINISSMGNVNLDENNKVVWAFTDDEEPLVIDPRAFIQQDSEVCDKQAPALLFLPKYRLSVSHPKHYFILLF